jgi:NAD+ synthase (glutamine-hydrolysing)
MKIALGQIDPTVGDIDSNVDKMAAWSERASARGADLIVFPELAITGYPPEDLVLKEGFVQDNLKGLEELAKATAAGCAVVCGFVDLDEAGRRNAAAFLSGGAIEARYHKVKLPNYGVFDERRYFVAGDSASTITIGDEPLGLSVCEDAWEPGMPWETYARDRVPMVLNINGSPYHVDKSNERLAVLRARALETGAWIAYVNTVGGQDELVFDGGSLVIAPDGSIACRAAMFEEDLVVVSFEDGKVTADQDATWPEHPGDVYEALVLGTRDYVRKNGFEEGILALSGGIDSALVATIAADALGPQAVRAFAMPSPYSAAVSLEDATEVARRLEIRLDVVPIELIMESYGDALSEVFAGTGSGLAEENVQARIRGNLLMAVSNRFGSIVLATGNKSEYAVGYSTLYGDMAGGFAPIKDVPKMLVYELARWRNSRGPEAGPIPERVLTKPPTAELRAGQLDTDSLPPYEALDPIIEAYVEQDMSADQIVAAGIGDRPTVERVIAMIDRAEYKRRQAAPGVKITPKAFGRDRRLPITNRYR